VNLAMSSRLGACETDFTMASSPIYPGIFERSIRGIA
jgi:hypothetical protein